MTRLPSRAPSPFSRRACSALSLILSAIALALFPLYIPGCGGTDAPQQNKDYFTSGSKEADQRAQQRMAQSQQLSGQGSGATATGDEKSLYDRLGGQAGVAALVSDWVDRAMVDPRVNWNRKDVTQGGLSIHRDRSEEWKPSPEDVKVMKAHIAEFIALSSGGPSIYQGKDMKSTHQDMHISNPEFDAAVGDLKASLDKMQIANKEQKELLAIIETTRAQIVTEQ
jgi:hemoglobin